MTARFWPGNRRLRLSLAAADALNRPDCERIAMLHYPPVGRDRKPTELTRLLTAAGVSRCCYGHIHTPAVPGKPPDFVMDGVRYILASADRLCFKPLRL
jgi:predicted phosphohydrolase